MTSYYHSTVTMGLSRTVSEIDDISVENRKNFPTSVYFTPPLTGFPLELGTGARSQKTRMMGLPDDQKKLI